MQSAFLFAMLLALVLGTPLTDNTLVLQNGASTKKGVGLQTPSLRNINAVIGAGWYPFQFGNQGTFAADRYLFYAPATVLLRLTDYFCTGDSFVIYDYSTLLGASPIVPAGCGNTTTEPFFAFDSLAWSSWYAFLPSGNHNISILVGESPLSAGSAAIRFDYIFATS